MEQTGNGYAEFLERSEIVFPQADDDLDVGPCGELLRNSSAQVLLDLSNPDASCLKFFCQLLNGYGVLARIAEERPRYVRGW